MTFRFIHTADWHLGRVFQQISLLEDQALLLEQMYQKIVALDAQALIIAGDIFDRANPRREAIDLFSSFLSRLYKKTAMAIVVIAGNHDAPELIGYGGILQDSKRVLIRGSLEQDAAPLVLGAGGGRPVAISALPYSDVFAARRHFSDADVQTVEDVLRCQVEEARTEVPEGARWIVTAHAFVQGGRASESERALDLVGGIETVSADIFEEADYVALGHLHRSQTVKSKSIHIRYSGSIMPYGFDEADIEKSLIFLEMEEDGQVKAEQIVIKGPRTLRVVQGMFADILEEGAGKECGDFVKFELADALPVHDAMNRLRNIYPNAVQIEWLNLRSGDTGGAAKVQRNLLRPPAELFADFYAQATGKPFDAELGRVLDDAIAGLDRD